MPSFFQQHQKIHALATKNYAWPPVLSWDYYPGMCPMNDTSGIKCFWHFLYQKIFQKDLFISSLWWWCNWGSASLNPPCVSGYSLIFKGKEEGKGRGGDREGLFGACTHSPKHTRTHTAGHLLRVMCAVLCPPKLFHVAHLPCLRTQSHSATKTGSNIHICTGTQWQEVIGASHERSMQV